ncbi:338_t:CDS:2 [Dentiscutata erythropus]|uniref:338_t:CDS:1 n=1 Tax=Dentiscutata erythropus TaxID=1348616 RepID=A0A9N9GXH8_9GLOM|nr:338_t:CDS:2 [Dentiscutata erythropus]
MSTAKSSNSLDKEIGKLCLQNSDELLFKSFMATKNRITTSIPPQNNSIVNSTTNLNPPLDYDIVISPLG